jgi:hypothetical protein
MGKEKFLQNIFSTRQKTINIPTLVNALKFANITNVSEQDIQLAMEEQKVFVRKQIFDKKITKQNEQKFLQQQQINKQQQQQQEKQFFLQQQQQSSQIQKQQPIKIEKVLIRALSNMQKKQQGQVTVNQETMMNALISILAADKNTFGISDEEFNFIRKNNGTEAFTLLEKFYPTK